MIEGIRVGAKEYLGGRSGGEELEELETSTSEAWEGGRERRGVLCVSPADRCAWWVSLLTELVRACRTLWDGLVDLKVSVQRDRLFHGKGP